MKHHFVLGLTMSLTLASGGASAIDGKSYPPAMCTPTLGGPLYDWNYGVGQTALTNVSGQARQIICPIVRDFEATTFGLNWAAAWVNNPSGQTTTCTLYSVDVNGGSLDWSTKSTSGTGNQALYFGSEVNVSNIWSHYSLACTLPSGGALRSYTIYEET